MMLHAKRSERKGADLTPKLLLLFFLSSFSASTQVTIEDARLAATIAKDRTSREELLR